MRFDVATAAAVRVTAISEYTGIFRLKRSALQPQKMVGAAQLQAAWRVDADARALVTAASGSSSSSSKQQQAAAESSSSSKQQQQAAAAAAAAAASSSKQQQQHAVAAAERTCGSS
jgi:hypothetical protein